MVGYTATTEVCQSLNYLQGALRNGKKKADGKKSQLVCNHLIQRA